MNDNKRVYFFIDGTELYDHPLNGAEFELASECCYGKDGKRYKGKREYIRVLRDDESFFVSSEDFDGKIVTVLQMNSHSKEIYEIVPVVHDWVDDPVFAPDKEGYERYLDELGKVPNKELLLTDMGQLNDLEFLMIGVEHGKIKGENNGLHINDPLNSKEYLKDHVEKKIVLTKRYNKLNLKRKDTNKIYSVMIHEPTLNNTLVYLFSTAFNGNPNGVIVWDWFCNLSYIEELLSGRVLSLEGLDIENLGTTVDIPFDLWLD